MSDLATTFGLSQALAFVAAGSVVQTVYQDLRKCIITLELPPDTTLAGRELTETCEVSQTPIREALRALSQEGLVRIQPQSRMVVTRIDIPAILEAHFLRVSLDTEVCRGLAAAEP